MTFFSRETLIDKMNNTLPQMINKYNLEDIGIFEEEGEGNIYYIGYTVRKNGEVYMIHFPHEKNIEGKLAPLEEEKWVIESDDGDTNGYDNLDAAFDYLSNGLKHW
jgi:hypothetical protein